MPTISIIVPVYKVEEYLPARIRSILRQTYRDFELILVDDGSSDRSGDICDEFDKQDKRIRVIHERDKGVSPCKCHAIVERITFISSKVRIIRDRSFLLRNMSYEGNRSV